jgi:hypothetical protein
LSNIVYRHRYFGNLTVNLPDSLSKPDSELLLFPDLTPLKSNIRTIHFDCFIIIIQRRKNIEYVSKWVGLDAWKFQL